MSPLGDDNTLSIKGDIDLEEIESETHDYESGPAEYEITTYPADFTLEVLFEKWKNGDIKIPDFQRQFVWKQTQASKLIESFLVGLPVPAIFLYTERKSQKYFVIDGQQRLKSIFYFFEGFFGEEKGGKRDTFRLKGLSDKSKWKDKQFSDFDDADQRKLKNSVLRAFIVQQLNPEDETSIYHIFERLNTGGTLLTNQEVRNCVYGGKFNDLLPILNRNEHWRTILGKPVPDSRQKDIELILRFFGLQKLDKYEKPLKDWLSTFMRRNRNSSNDWLQLHQQQFEETSNAVASKLGQKPFHVRAGLNSAVFDSVMVAFSRHLTEIPSDIRNRYDILLANTDFKKLTSSSTTDVENLKQRFILAESILFS